MPTVTFQVLEGIDKGRTFREMPTPVSIGREEGNVVRLNDERVSRFHARVQSDNDEIILTDLESTNGTRVNGSVVQIRRLRPGDRVGIGRSLLLFGSNAEIEARRAALGGPSLPPTILAIEGGSATIPLNNLASHLEQELNFDVSAQDKIALTPGHFLQGANALPSLPDKMTPSQAARLSELLDFLHKQITGATENIQSNDEGTQITLSFLDWQKVQSMQMLLAQYVRAVTEPDILNE
jgi:pSer/pThr/pTyr-binding forkhead associated (FHA) protein